jgi:hypothetical protein
MIEWPVAHDALRMQAAFGEPVAAVPTRCGGDRRHAEQG